MTALWVKLKSFQLRNVTKISKIAVGTNLNSQTRQCVSSNGNSPNDSFGQSMILLQDGLNIQELPIIVRRVSNGLTVLRNKGEIQHARPNEDRSFKECTTIEGVLNHLNALPAEEVSPTTACNALIRIEKLGRKTRELIKISFPEADPEAINISFTLEAVLSNIVNKISTAGSSDNVVESLRCLSDPSFPGQVELLQKKLIDSCTHHILDGNCSILQVCSAIEIFAKLSRKGVCCPSLVDKVWVGILQSAEGINTENIVQVFEVLPHLKLSQRIVLQVLQRELPYCAKKLGPCDFITILNVLELTKLPSENICKKIPSWLGNILHDIDASAMKKLVQHLSNLNSFDISMALNLERFVKSQKRDGIKNQELISLIATYTKESRFRSVLILNVLSNYFVQHWNELSPTTVHSILTTFGYFGHDPSNDNQFWTLTEQLLERHLEDYPTEYLLDIFLACVYLQRHPMNFVPRIFSPNFIGRIHALSPSAVEVARSKLKLFDGSMALECSQYSRLVLPKDSAAKSLYRDGRLKRMSNTLIPLIEEVSGPQFQVISSVILAGLPLNDLYIVDVLISPAGKSPHFRYGYQRPSLAVILVLIHLPEHYAHDQTSLIGPQLMRRRHMIKMGFRIVELNYNHLVNVVGKNDVIRRVLHNQLEPHLEECRKLL